MEIALNADCCSAAAGFKPRNGLSSSNGGLSLLATITLKNALNISNNPNISTANINALNSLHNININSIQKADSIHSINNKGCSNNNSRIGQINGILTENLDHLNRNNKNAIVDNYANKLIHLKEKTDKLLELKDHQYDVQPIEQAQQQQSNFRIDQQKQRDHNNKQLASDKQNSRLSPAAPTVQSTAIATEPSTPPPPPLPLPSPSTPPRIQPLAASSSTTSAATSLSSPSTSLSSTTSSSFSLPSNDDGQLHDKHGILTGTTTTTTTLATSNELLAAAAAASESYSWQSLLSMEQMDGTSNAFRFNTADLQSSFSRQKTTCSATNSSKSFQQIIHPLDNQFTDHANAKQQMLDAQQNMNLNPNHCHPQHSANISFATTTTTTTTTSVNGDFHHIDGIVRSTPNSKTSGSGNAKHNTKIPSDILDDLASRFIINVPDIELNNLIRLCFQIELAHWFYLDFYCNGDDDNKKLQTCGMRHFSMQLFQHIPFLRHNSASIDKILEDWKNYKLSVPTYGAILISEDLKYCLLVQSYFAKSSWGFPKGKVNESEDPINCAIREVYEETGYDITKLIAPDEFIEAVVNYQYTRLYIICDVALETKFSPRTRNEIKCCDWFPIDSLPANKGDTISKAKLGINANSFFMIMPFVKRLKRWVNAKRCALHHHIQCKHSDDGCTNPNAAEPDDANTTNSPITISPTIIFQNYSTNNGICRKLKHSQSNCKNNYNNYANFNDMIINNDDKKNALTTTTTQTTNGALRKGASFSSFNSNNYNQYHNNNNNNNRNHNNHFNSTTTTTNIIHNNNNNNNNHYYNCNSGYNSNSGGGDDHANSSNNNNINNGKSSCSGDGNYYKNIRQHNNNLSNHGNRKQRHKSMGDLDVTNLTIYNNSNYNNNHSNYNYSNNKNSYNNTNDAIIGAKTSKLHASNHNINPISNIISTNYNDSKWNSTCSAYPATTIGTSSSSLSPGSSSSLSSNRELPLVIMPSAASASTPVSFASYPSIGGTCEKSKIPAITNNPTSAAAATLQGSSAETTTNPTNSEVYEWNRTAARERRKSSANIADVAFTRDSAILAASLRSSCGNIYANCTKALQGVPAILSPAASEMPLIITVSQVEQTLTKASATAGGEVAKALPSFTIATPVVNSSLQFDRRSVSVRSMESVSSSSDERLKNPIDNMNNNDESDENDEDDENYISEQDDDESDDDSSNRNSKDNINHPTAWRYNNRRNYRNASHSGSRLSSHKHHFVDYHQQQQEQGEGEEQMAAANYDKKMWQRNGRNANMNYNNNNNNKKKNNNGECVTSQFIRYSYNVRNRNNVTAIASRASRAANRIRGGVGNNGIRRDTTRPSIERINMKFSRIDKYDNNGKKLEKKSTFSDNVVNSYKRYTNINRNGSISVSKSFIQEKCVYRNGEYYNHQQYQQYSCTRSVPKHINSNRNRNHFHSDHHHYNGSMIAKRFHRIKYNNASPDNDKYYHNSSSSNNNNNTSGNENNNMNKCLMSSRTLQYSNIQLDLSDVKVGELSCRNHLAGGRRFNFRAVGQGRYFNGDDDGDGDVDVNSDGGGYQRKVQYRGKQRSISMNTTSYEDYIRQEHYQQEEENDNEEDEYQQYDDEQQQEISVANRSLVMPASNKDSHNDGEEQQQQVENAQNLAAHFAALKRCSSLQNTTTISDSNLVQKERAAFTPTHTSWRNFTFTKNVIADVFR